MIASDRGLTLVEVMIAVAVISVGLSSVLAALPFATYATREGAQLSTATFLATQRLEAVRGARWRSGPPALDEIGVSRDGAPVSGSAVTFPDEIRLAAPYGDFSRIVRIADCGAGACGGVARSDLRQVTVTVAYRPTTAAGVAPSGTLKAAVVTTFVAQR